MPPFVGRVAGVGTGDRRFYDMGRSELAKRIFPEASQKDAGCALAHIIHKYQVLRDAMYASGYRLNRKGYTARQVEMIVRFLEMHPEVKTLPPTPSH